MSVRVPTIEPDFIDEAGLRAYFGDRVEVVLAERLIVTDWRDAMPLDDAEDVSQDVQRAIAFVRREMQRSLGTVGETVESSRR